ncbi:MAG: outer membrane beta-barrel protein [Bacteroidota bacterium]
MKTFVLHFFLFLISIHLSAQYGVRAGFNNSSYDSSEDYDAYIQGYHIGVFYDAKMASFLKLRTSVLYSKQGGARDNVPEQIRFNYLKVPLEVIFKTYTNDDFHIDLHLGGYWGYMINGKYKGENQPDRAIDFDNGTDVIDRKDFGASFTVAFNFGNKMIGLEGVSSIKDIDDRLNANFKGYNRSINLIGAYTF